MSRLCLCLILALTLVTKLPAAPKSVDLPGIKPLIAARLEQVERDIAQLSLQRPQTPPGEIALLELQIDLRILVRHLQQNAADAKPESDAQVNTYLRAMQLQGLLSSLENTLRAQLPQQPLSRTQSEAMVGLHQLTYTLADAKSGNTVDLGRTVGQLLVRIASSTPLELKTLPAMRPDQSLTKPRPKPAGPAPQARRGIPQLCEEVRQAAISVPLRQQLLALAAAAQSAVDDKAKDANELNSLLSDSVDLAKGLAGNTAVNPQARTLIEKQLAEALALYLDPRTRSAGQSRIDGLSQYRQILTRVGKLALPPELKDRLAPVFTWAQENPETGLKVLATLDRFATLSSQYDATGRGASTSETLKRPMEEIKKHFEAGRQDFLDDATQVTTRGPMSKSPQELAGDVDELAKSLKLIDTLAALPRAVDTLNSYKPRPAGNLERRMSQAAVAAANLRANGHNESIAMLEQIVQLAQSATLLHDQSPGDLGNDALNSLSGGQHAALENKWRALVGELASQLAGGNELDKAKLARLDQAGGLRQAMRTAAALNDSLSKAKALEKWADWMIPADRLASALSPWREALSGAYRGYVEEQPDAVDRWEKINRRLAPLIALLERDAAYAEQMAAWPGGLNGQVAQLLTPLDNQPFATERYASFALDLWAAWQAQADPATAETVMLVLARRIAQDLNLADPDAAPPPRPATQRARTP